MELKEISKKILLIGDSKVGKTAIVNRLITGKFVEEYVPGTGMLVSQKILQFIYPNLVVNLKLSIYDVAGQREYSRIRDSAMTGADGVIIVSDLSRPETITSADEFWLKEVRSTMGNVLTTYFGNKVDLVTKEGPSEQLLEKVGARRGSPVFIGSAKTGLNVDSVFDDIGERLVKNLMAGMKKEKKGKPETVMEVFDYIMGDFCAQYGDMEKAMLFAENQFLEVGMDIRNPSKEGILEILNRFEAVESMLLTESIARANYTERKAMIEAAI